jgi:hypothetical protein
MGSWSAKRQFYYLGRGQTLQVTSKLTEPGCSENVKVQQLSLVVVQ